MIAAPLCASCVEKLNACEGYEQSRAAAYVDLFAAHQRPFGSVNSAALLASPTVADFLARRDSVRRACATQCGGAA